ncbi:recombinase family protein [Deinococcus aquiradiocola]|uniref:Transposase n=1 Tax=Deinococcus aquiradiocola TaxID=393059 RepID=A0A917PPS6_9DEIO|nr:recombinase family protein [Deinococcus aquiradiocola]GGJ87298.1 transposase [Deinococcus aquiradiocola]
MPDPAPRKTRARKTAPVTATPAPGPTTGQHVAYIRVSSGDQNTARQLEGLHFDRTFTDKASGKNTSRPAFTEMLQFLRHGDTLTVHSMDRLARNLGDLRTVVLNLTGRGIEVRFVKENLVFKGDDSAMSMLLLNVMGAFAEFERSLIRERQREGIALAKEAGVYKGRKPSLNAAQVEDLRRRAAAGEAKAKLARDFGISRETVYTYLP